jgi:hypothetical protein
MMSYCYSDDDGDDYCSDGQCDYFDDAEDQDGNDNYLYDNEDRAFSPQQVYSEDDDYHLVSDDESMVSSDDESNSKADWDFNEDQMDELQDMFGSCNHYDDEVDSESRDVESVCDFYCSDNDCEASVTCDEDYGSQDCRPSSPPLDFDIGYDDDIDDSVQTTYFNQNVKSTVEDVVFEEPEMVRSNRLRDSVCGAPSAIPAPVRESIVCLLNDPNSVSCLFECFSIEKRFVSLQSLCDRSNLHAYELGRDPPPNVTLVGDCRFGFG